MKKNKKIFIMIIVFVILIIITLFMMNKFLKNPTNESIINILKEHGFKLENELYVKQKSELTRKTYNKNVLKGIGSYTEIMYFDLKSYQLNKTSFDYYKGMTTKFNSTYDYKKESLTFLNEIKTEKNSYTFEGEYSDEDDSFGCKITKTDGPKLTESETEYICSNIEDEVDRFYNESVELFENTDIRKKIKET